MTNKHISQASFDADICGRAATIEFTRTTLWGRENFGADADGRRGIIINTVDDEIASDVMVEFEDCVATPLSLLLPDVQTAVTTAVEEYMESHDVEEFDEEDRCDYDDVDD